jgi:lysophospholipase L1-like esterase
MIAGPRWAIQRAMLSVQPLAMRYPAETPLTTSTPGPGHRRCTALALAVALALAAALAAPAQAGGGFVSTQPAPRVEHWQHRQAAIGRELQDRARMAATRLVFVGDSITDFWLLDDNPWVSGQQYGRQVWNDSFAGSTPQNLALNIGISGDRTEHVLHRIQPRAAGGLGHLDAPALRPEFLVVMLGINNTWAAESPVADSVFEGVRAVLAAAHARQPQARIVLQSILPTNDPAKNRDVVQVVNQRLQALTRSPDWSAFTGWLDLTPGFVDAQGQQVAALFTDGLHPNLAGYRIWRDRLLPFLAAERCRAPAPAAALGSPTVVPPMQTVLIGVAQTSQAGTSSPVSIPDQGYCPST